MIKDAYEHLKKTHVILPEFDKLNNEFEISTIETEEFLLRQIRRKIAERFEPVLELFEHIINPDPGSFNDAYECRALTNGEKKQLIELFRKMMENYRLLTEADLLCDDKTDADSIRKISDQWVEQKKQVIPLIKKLRANWQKQVEPTEILDYLG